MPDERAISKRLDLTYVRRTNWPWTIIQPIGLVLVLGFGALAAVSVLNNDYRLHTAGPLTRAHAMFGDNCNACHQPTAGSTGYRLPVQDEACLACHVPAASAHDPHASMFVGVVRAVPGLTSPQRMSGSCAACHTEHRGESHRISRVPDHACVQCHADLSSRRFKPSGALNGAKPTSNVPEAKP
ncbi:MAG: cytochrome c3 family protein [Phycisphaerae bacterium]|nr:cytochrome c3 family protein [Phycisphaerae bacterium]